MMTKTKATHGKATHSGHCQACGSLQKLPGGVLSKHGYTVEHGYFSGTCRGSGYRAFEESCDQVQRYVAEAAAHRADLQDFCHGLRADVTTKAWVSNYERNPHTGRSGYVTRQVEVQVERKTVDYGPSYGGPTEVSTFYYEAPGFKKAPGTIERHTLDPDYKLKLTTLEAVAGWLNAKWADRVESTEVAQLTRYIAWQQERVAGWEPAELLPVDAKRDKQGFEVMA